MPDRDLERIIAELERRQELLQRLPHQLPKRDNDRDEKTAEHGERASVAKD